MPFSPTDANGYVSPNVPVTNNGYPRWMYHPTNPPQVVIDQPSEAALVAADSQWSRTDPNATT